MHSSTINDAMTIAGNGEGALLANRYRVVRQLGQGGMGSVWLAEDTQLDDKPFAIKMLPSILVSNKRAYNQLKAEALVAMKLTHPNIVTLRAFEENNGNPFLVMDYVDGQTLDDYLADYGSRVEHVERVDGNGGGARRPAEPGGPRDRDARACSPSGQPGGLPESDVLRILKPVAAALDYAHGEGVVHRDVKPANVMIRKDGHPFILDFGIAREIQETMTRVTGKLSSGTLLYMSPEQLMGESPKPAQDIYSFAAMAYECLKGEPPFSHGQIEFQIMNKQPELPSGRTQLVASVMAGLAKKPEDRPATCAAVLEGKDFSRVERVEGGNGRARRPAEPGGSRSRATEPGGPRSRATVKGLLAAALLAALAGGAWWFVNARAVRSTGTTGVPPVVTNAPSGTGVSPVVTADDVAGIAVEATVQKARIERLDDADGFKARKDSLADALVRATSNGKAKRWAEAAQGFTNYVKECKELLKLNQDRQSAKTSRDEAESAKELASKAKASQYAEESWNKACASLKEANDLFDKRSFVDAESKYKAAAGQFGGCVNEARAEEKLYTAAKAIRFEALKMQPKIERISDADGFYGEKKKRVDLFSSANACFDERVKRWAEAAQGFTNYVKECEALIALDEERHAAKKSQAEAEAAKTCASEAEALQYAETRWNAAIGFLEAANDLFGKMEFGDATLKYAAAAKQFDLCVDEAKAERKRQEEARERAMSIEAEIVRDIEPELKRFKAEDCVKDTLADGNNLRKEGNAAFSRGDFPEAEGKLIQAKEKLAAAAKEAKACRVAASLRRAREHSVTSRWQQCIDECDKVLGWDPANTEAKDLKSRAEVSGSSLQRQPVTAYPGPHYEYIVEKGQTLSLIAKGFGTTVSKILAANPRLSQGGLRVGQKLIIPADSQETGAPSSRRQPVTAYTGPHYEYIVEKGQTLSLIAEGFGTTVSKILAANPGLSQGGLRIGQKLIIPAE